MTTVREKRTQGQRQREKAGRFAGALEVIRDWMAERRPFGPRRDPSNHVIVAAVIDEGPIVIRCDGHIQRIHPYPTLTIRITTRAELSALGMRPRKVRKGSVLAVVLNGDEAIDVEISWRPAA